MEVLECDRHGFQSFRLRPSGFEDEEEDIRQSFEHRSHDGILVGNDGADFLESFLSFQKGIAIWNAPCRSEPPRIFGSEVSGYAIFYGRSELRDGDGNKREQGRIMPSVVDLLVVESWTIEHEMAGFMICIMTDKLLGDVFELLNLLPVITLVALGSLKVLRPNLLDM